MNIILFLSVRFYCSISDTVSHCDNVNFSGLCTGIDFLTNLVKNENERGLKLPRPQVRSPSGAQVHFSIIVIRANLHT